MTKKPSEKQLEHAADPIEDIIEPKKRFNVYVATIL